MFVTSCKCSLKMILHRAVIEIILYIRRSGLIHRNAIVIVIAIVTLTLKSIKVKNISSVLLNLFIKSNEVLSWVH